MCEFCENCKVNIIDEKSNCVLCGKSISKKQQSKNKFYPKYSPVVEKREPVVNVLEKLALLGLLICVVVDLFITKTISWSLYVFVGVLLATVLILRAIKKKNTIAQLLTRLTFWLSLFIIFIELYTNSWGWGLTYAIPFMWLGFSVFAGIMTLSKGYVDFQMFKPIILIAILSTISLIVLLCIGHGILWPSLIAVLVTVSEIALMFMFRFKRSVRSLKKDFGF